MSGNESQYDAHTRSRWRSEFDDGGFDRHVIILDLVRERLSGHRIQRGRGLLQILQARRDALTTLLREADSLEEILRLNDAVDDVLIRIEELKGRVKLINDQTSKATISVELHEEGAAPQDDDDASIVDAWSSSIDGFLRVVGAIVIGIGYLLPIVVLAGLGWVVVRSARRRPAER